MISFRLVLECTGLYACLLGIVLHTYEYCKLVGTPDETIVGVASGIILVFVLAYLPDRDEKVVPKGLPINSIVLIGGFIHVTLKQSTHH